MQNCWKSVSHSKYNFKYKYVIHGLIIGVFFVISPAPSYSVWTQPTGSLYQSQPEDEVEIKNNLWRLDVENGSGSGYYRPGETVPIEAGESHRSHHNFSHWTSLRGVELSDPRSAQTTFVMPAHHVNIQAHFLPGPPISDPNFSVARRWVEVILQAIRVDIPYPTVHARNLFHLSAVMYDAWAIFSEPAKPYLFGDQQSSCVSSDLISVSDKGQAAEEAISYAARKLILHRFRSSPGYDETKTNVDNLMFLLGYKVSEENEEKNNQEKNQENKKKNNQENNKRNEKEKNLSVAAQLGSCLGEHYISRGLTDGSNEANGYKAIYYEPVNPPLRPNLPGNPQLVDPDRWQPLELDAYTNPVVSTTPSAPFGPRGLVGRRFDTLATKLCENCRLVTRIPDFVTPEWGRVTAFSLSEEDLVIHQRDGNEYHVYHDPGPPPLFRGPDAESYKWGFTLVALWSAQLSPNDNVMMDISPASTGNIGSYPQTSEEYPDFYKRVFGPGYHVNPVTGKPYEAQMVPRGDYTRVLAEFWADGPDSETPPGHWVVILNSVSDHDQFVRRFGGQGPDSVIWNGM